MLERFKTVFLTFLIALSILLTYRLWFGRPPLEKGTLPRYEYAYFTEIPHPSAIILPAETIFEHDDLRYVFPRGDHNTGELWEEAQRIMLLPGKMIGTQIEKEESGRLLTKSSFKIIYKFKPQLPPEFISEEFSSIPGLIREIIFLWDEEFLKIIVCGEKDLYWQYPSQRGEGLQERLLSLQGQPYQLLPAVFKLLKVEDSGVGNWQVLAEVEDESYEAQGADNGQVQGGEDDNVLEKWKIHVDENIYLPEQEIWASELSLSKEEIDRNQLIRSFFYDLSMARRIEEQDGALYYTDGERGLRLYPSGLIEYMAPGLETVKSNIPYLVSLQKGAEKQSLYGGWLPGTYLVEAEKTRGGYQLLWYNFHEGLFLKGKNIGSKMIVNEQGVPFYLRCFYLPGERVSEPRPFRPFEEALYQALKYNQESLQGKKVVLLTLEPVYYYDENKFSNKAIPAWSVKFAETEEVYLHWSSLEILNDPVTGGGL